MQPVVIYTKSTCSYCHAAKALLRKKNAPFQEISVEGDRAAQEAMAVKANGRWTVPQIFIGDAHVGGCDDIHALDAAGKLDPLLAG
jgi:glutaredoxin 3